MISDHRAPHDIGRIELRSVLGIYIRGHVPPVFSHQTKPQKDHASGENRLAHALSDGRPPEAHIEMTGGRRGMR